MRALHGRFETAVDAGDRSRRAGDANARRGHGNIERAAGLGHRSGSARWNDSCPERLAAAFPADGFQGEEGGIARGGTLRWVVDPIDGTANYMRGSPRFCVSLACLEDRAPLIGVVVAPALGETYVARQGGGAMLNGTADPCWPKPPLWIRRSSRSVGRSDGPTRISWPCPKSCWRRAQDCGSAGSGTLGLADVAAGRSDAYVELHINLWDVAAALVLLAESGAAVSPFLEGDGPTAGNPILACAPGVGGALSALSGFAAH